MMSTERILRLVLLAILLVLTRGQTAAQPADRLPAIGTVTIGRNHELLVKDSQIAPAEDSHRQ